MTLNNPFWFALKTEHARLALGSEHALRYSADVLPFGGFEKASAEGLTALHHLLRPGETIFIVADHLPEGEGLQRIDELIALQLHFRGDIERVKSSDARDVRIQRLGTEHAGLMLSLTNIAFPGFFRERTCELGAYFGVFDDDQLVAMAGERVAIPGLREISAVCTHPKYTGKGYATALIRQLLRFHREHHLGSFLHVAADNKRAIDLYEHLGFMVTGTLRVHELERIRL